MPEVPWGGRWWTEVCEAAASGRESSRWWIVSVGSTGGWAGGGYSQTKALREPKGAPAYLTMWTGAKLNNEQENSVNHCRIEENMHSRSSTPGGDRKCNVHRLQ